MEKISRMWRSGLSLLLALCMVVGMCPVVTFATETEEKDNLIYVSIGDSMTNGYGLDGYDGESGIMNYGNNVYSNQFAAYLAGYDGEIKNDQTVFTGTNGTVDHRQLAMSGMRAEDLAWLLQLNCTDDNYAKLLVRFKNDPWSFKWDGKSYSGYEYEWGGGREYWFSKDVENPTEVINGYGFRAGDWRTWTDLLDPDYRLADGAAKILSMYGKEGFGFVSDSVKVTDGMISTAKSKLSADAYYPKDGLNNSRDLFGAEGRWLRFVAEFYQDSVADADVITLALGNTNFGTFMFDTIKDIFLNPTAKNWFPSRYHIDEVYLMAEAAGVDAEMMAMIKQLINDQLKPMLADFGDVANEPLPETVVDGSAVDPYGLLKARTKGALIEYIVEYCVLSYIVNYVASIERIVELNSDVEIIQIALMNAYKTGNSSNANDGTSFAGIIDKIYAPMNAFIAKMPDYLANKYPDKYKDATFYFADCGTVETLSAVFGNDFYTYDGKAITYDAYQEMLANGTLDVTKLGHKDSTVRERFHHWLASSQGCRHSRKGGNEKNTYGAHIYCSDCYLAIEMAHKPTSGGWGWCDVTEYGEMWKGLLGPLECPYTDDETAPTAEDKAVWQAGNWDFSEFFGKYRLTYVTEADIIEYEKLSADEKNARLNSTETKAHKTAEGYDVTVGVADLAFSCAMYLAFEDATIRAGKNEFMINDLTSVSGLGYDTFGGAVELFAEKMGVSSVVNEVPEETIDAYKLMKNFSDALVEDGPSATMLCLANRMQIGTGIGGHPSEGGHDTMAAAIIRDYEAQNTGDKLMEEFMLSYLEAKYPKVFEKLNGSSNETNDDLAIIISLLKKSNNPPMSAEELDALEAEIRASLRAFKESKTPEQQAAAQEDVKELMTLLWDLAAAITGVKYEPTETSFYVSLGDSNVNGYGLDGYETGTNGGHLQKVPGSAPVKLAKALYGDEWETKFGPFAMGSLRSEDLLYLLGGEGVVIDDYFTDEVLWRVEETYGTSDTIEKAQGAFEEVVKKADLISIAIGGGNVTTFTGEQMDRLAENEDLVEMDWDKIGYDDAATMEQLHDMIAEMAPLADMMGLMDKYVPEGANISNPTQFSGVLLESLLYGYASYSYYYPQVLARIREINPDAQLLILGMFNPVDYWTTEMDGKVVNIGGIVDNVMNSANLQNLAYALQNPNTVFVDLGETETILDDQVQKGEKEYTFDNYYNSILMGDGLDAHASADGHEYMFHQMSAALSGEGFDAEKMDLLEKLYEGLTDTYLTTQEKLGVLSDIYSYVKEKGMLDKYPEIVTVEEIYAFLQENDYISDEQTLDIILYVYAYLLEKQELDSDDMLKIAEFIFKTLLENEKLTDEDRVDIVVNIYEILEADGYLAVIIDLAVAEMREKWPNLDYEIVELLEEEYDLDREREIKLEQLAKDPGNEELQQEIADLEARIDAIDARIGVLRDNVTTNLEYVRDCETSSYVALGDMTSASESYADKLAEALDVEYLNLAAEGVSVLDTYDVLKKNEEAIASADLITLGYGTNQAFKFAVEQILAEMQGERETLDWKQYAGEAGVAYIDKIRATVENKLLEKGLTDEMNGHTMAHLMTVGIEAYVYCGVSYAWNLPELINAIRVVNDDAMVLVIGMYNPLKDKSIVGDSVTLPLGEYIDSIIDGVEIHSLAYAMMSGNCMYVHAPDVAIDNTQTELEILEFVNLYFDSESSESMYPNEAGHTYIKDQIMDALNETIIDHADENADHLCDKCKKTLSACADEDQDHLCDYAGCGEELSECIDADKDHACDNGCDKVYGEHADEDKDHDCDYGCEETFGECEDEDQDHACDYGCDKVYGEHADTNQDHKCEYCGEALTKCLDADDDHICDICGKKVLRCVDKDDDHKCDDCGKVISECEDTNKDHECDTCGKELSKCEDANQDHKCDTCKTELSNCADTDKDHICDTCGECIDAHADADADGKCDTCGNSVGSDEETVTVTGVTRISGKDRTATARKIADELKEITGTEKFDAIVYASGDVFADALAGTYLANMENAPILLHRAGSEEANQKYIVENLNEGGFVYILGGTKAIPAAVDTALRNAGVQVVRLSGKTRIETNIEILEETGFAGGETVLVCTGYEYADSLSASATGMPILLVEKGAEYLRDAQIDYLKSLDAECDFVVIGGTAAVTADLVEALEAYDADGEVERLSGKTRYETSIKLAETFFTSDRIVLAYGREFADGLCGGTLAYTLGVPVVLAEESMADVVAEYTKEAKITSGYVLGGTARLTDKPVRTIFQMAASDEIVVK